MKISILILILSGVRQSGSQVKLGFEAGMNLSNTTLSADDEKQMKGFCTGLYFEYCTSNRFSMQCGIQYIQKGCESDNGTVKVTHKQDYLLFPFALKITFPVGRFRPFVTGGFYCGFSLSAKQEQSYSTGEQYYYNVANLYSGGEAGFTYGGGISFKLSKVTEINIEVRRALGVSNVTGNDLLKGSNKGTELLTGIKIKL